MTKEKFVGILNKLKAADRLEDNIAVLLDDYNKKYGDIVDNYGLVLSHQDLVIDLLAELLDDKFDDIAYFCHELDFGDNYIPGCVTDQDGKEIDLSCPKSLYDYLVSNNG